MPGTGFSRGLCLVLALCLVPLGPGIRLAHAELVSTAAVVGADHGDAAPHRQRVHRFLDRADVRSQLEELGISSDEAHRRVAALTNAEIAQINGRLDEVPAGGSFAGAVLGVILVVFLVLVITDLLGASDVFPFIDPLPRGQAGSP